MATPLRNVFVCCAAPRKNHDDELLITANVPSEGGSKLRRGYTPRQQQSKLVPHGSVWTNSRRASYSHNVTGRPPVPKTMAMPLERHHSVDISPRLIRDVSHTGRTLKCDTPSTAPPDSPKRTNKPTEPKSSRKSKRRPMLMSHELSNAVAPCSEGAYVLYSPNPPTPDLKASQQAPPEKPERLVERRVSVSWKPASTEKPEPSVERSSVAMMAPLPTPASVFIPSSKPTLVPPPPVMPRRLSSNASVRSGSHPVLHTNGLEVPPLLPPLRSNSPRSPTLVSPSKSPSRGLRSSLTKVTLSPRPLTPINTSPPPQPANPVLPLTAKSTNFVVPHALTVSRARRIPQPEDPAAKQLAPPPTFDITRTNTYRTIAQSLQETKPRNWENALRTVRSIRVCRFPIAVSLSSKLWAIT
eukprot:Protomagalhaensia_wolfi_Nauph_80__6170@NODE_907_length_1895_cov_24_383082_g683_i0_p1_GENE_NODE_907_length_1895_cov_24_383082_g683_i0NODE_907_length_1895_cov_24_383082_g683_i0_p1_ORF_typecomplete_len413_score49_63_NODE_907_length_1895_cov_24_383082_g683_i0351273